MGIELKPWDRSLPLENTKSPHPENPGKLLKNYNLAHSGTVLKITEKLLKIYKITEKLPKKYTFSIFLVIFGNFQDSPGVGQIVIFE